MIKGGFIRDLKLNLLFGNIAFILQRITGLALVAYLFMHIWTLSAVRSSPRAFSESMSAFDSTFGHFIEWMLLLCVAVHMFNGIRVCAVDFCGATRRQRFLLFLAAFALVVTAVVAVPVFFPEIFK